MTDSPDAEDETCWRICLEITHYLMLHPKASDTAAGIKAWWLSAQIECADVKAIEEALDYLVKTGLILNTKLGDGSVLYHLPDLDIHSVH